MAKEFESNGVKVEIPDELESVVALEYSFVEALAKLELNVTGIADDKDKNNLEHSIKHLVGNYTSVGSRLEPDAELIKKADLVLVMSKNQSQHIEQKWPFAKGKVFRLGHWQSQNVPDPYQHDQAFFDETCKNIQLYANDWQSHL